MKTLQNYLVQFNTYQELNNDWIISYAGKLHFFQNQHMQCSKFHRILVTVVSCLNKSLKKAPKITSSIGIGNHFTTCARIFDTDVVTGDEDASLDCLIARVSESTTALVSIFLVGRTTDVAHQRICLKKSKTLMCLADLLNTWFTLCY